MCRAAHSLSSLMQLTWSTLGGSGIPFRRKMQAYFLINRMWRDHPFQTNRTSLKSKYKMAASCNHHLALPQECSGHTEQLPFPHWEVLSILCHLWVEWMRQLADLRRNTQSCEDSRCTNEKYNLLSNHHTAYHFFNMRFLKSFPNLQIRVLVPRVQIAPVGT